MKSGNEEGLFKIGSVCRKNVIDEAKNYGSRNSATRFDKDAFRVLTVGIIPQTQATGQLASFVAISVKGNVSELLSRPVIDSFVRHSDLFQRGSQQWIH